MALRLPSLVAAAAPLLAAGGEAADPCPGPGPWDARAWVGAALYLVLFLAALAGIAALLRGDPGGGGRP